MSWAFEETLYSHCIPIVVPELAISRKAAPSALLQPYYVPCRHQGFMSFPKFHTSSSHKFCHTQLPKSSDLFSLIFLLFSCSVVSDSLQPHGLLHTRPPCPSPSPRACSNSCPLSRWCHPTISSSVVPFSSFPLYFPASESFPMSRLFASGG